MLYSAINGKSAGLIRRVSKIIVLGILSCSKEERLKLKRIRQRESSHFSGSNSVYSSSRLLILLNFLSVLPSWRENAEMGI